MDGCVNRPMPVGWPWVCRVRHHVLHLDERKEECEAVLHTVGHTLITFKRPVRKVGHWKACPVKGYGTQGAGRYASRACFRLPFTLWDHGTGTSIHSLHPSLSNQVHPQK
eukprot:364955-Chlamydomonas_euryale.AAC.29